MGHLNPSKWMEKCVRKNTQLRPNHLHTDGWATLFKQFCWLPDPVSYIRGSAYGCYDVPCLRSVASQSEQNQPRIESALCDDSFGKLAIHGNQSCHLVFLWHIILHGFRNIKCATILFKTHVNSFVASNRTLPHKAKPQKQSQHHLRQCSFITSVCSKQK